MYSLYKLIVKTNIKTPAIIFPFVMPLIFLLILSPGIDSNQEAAIVLVSIISVTTLQSGLMGFGFNFMNLKKSILLKRIGSTKITKTEALGGIALYGLTLYVISVTWTLILAATMSATGFFGTPIAGGETIRIEWSSITWGLLLISMILGLFLSYSLGMLVLSFTKDDQQYSLTVMFYFFLASFLGGMLIPGAINVEWMRWLGYFIPSVYNAHMFQAAGAGVEFTGAFDFANGYTYLASGGQVTMQGWEAAMNLFAPIIFGSMALGGAVKLFKWD